MVSNGPTVPLQEGLNLQELVTTGSILHINEVYVETEDYEEDNYSKSKIIDFIGAPVESISALEQGMKNVDINGFVKKKILDNGCGLPLTDKNTVTIAYSGYWEKELEPFDTRKTDKPLVVDLNDHGLLPGLAMAVESMLVGEMSIFILNYEVMYGELGMPPRIKPKANAVFFIKLIKSIITSDIGPIKFSEPNMFSRVHHEVKLLYSSGITLFKANNFQGAAQLFKKGINMLNKVRLADEKEEEIQEKLLKKLYTNIAICYNKNKQPSRACLSCNELNRLNALWNNSKALLINARALRMMGVFDSAEKKLKRALKLSPNNKELIAEYELLERIRNQCNQDKLTSTKSIDIVNEDFKQEVDNLIKNFKENIDLCQLTLPEGLNSLELNYIKEICIKENLFCNKISNSYALDREEAKAISDENSIDKIA